jgi:hypothetical protein
LCQVKRRSGFGIKIKTRTVPQKIGTWLLGVLTKVAQKASQNCAKGLYKVLVKEAQSPQSQRRFSYRRVLKPDFDKRDFGQTNEQQRHFND